METTLRNNQDSRNNLLAGEKLYNLAMVESVSGGDKEFIKKMVALFIETIPQDVQQMNKCAVTQDWVQVGKIAHKLKSTIDTMAIKSIQQDIRFVETNAKQQTSLELLPSLIDKITQVINICISQLRLELAD
jgi:HPt (histidine-containing phosphotransfer) domain-containing protein